MPRSLLPTGASLVLLGLAATACTPVRDVTVLKLAHGLDVEHPVHLAMEVMAETAGQLSNGTLRIDLYPGEQLGSERELLELVQLGILAMTKSSSAPMESFVPTMKVFGLPYLFRDADHLWKVLQGPLGAEILDSGTPYGLKGLGYYDAGARSDARDADPRAGRPAGTEDSRAEERDGDADGGGPGRLSDADRLG